MKLVNNQPRALQKRKQAGSKQNDASERCKKQKLQPKAKAGPSFKTERPSHKRVKYTPIFANIEQSKQNQIEHNKYKHILQHDHNYPVCNQNKAHKSLSNFTQNAPSNTNRRKAATSSRFYLQRPQSPASDIKRIKLWGAKNVGGFVCNEMPKSPDAPDTLVYDIEEQTNVWIKHNIKKEAYLREKGQKVESNLAQKTTSDPPLKRKVGRPRKNEAKVDSNEPPRRKLKTRTRSCVAKMRAEDPIIPPGYESSSLSEDIEPAAVQVVSPFSIDNMYLGKMFGQKEINFLDNFPFESLLKFPLKPPSKALFQLPVVCPDESKQECKCEISEFLEEHDIHCKMFVFSVYLF